MKFEYLYHRTGVVILIKQLYNSPFHLIKVFSVKMYQEHFTLTICISTSWEMLHHLIPPHLTPLLTMLLFLEKNEQLFCYLKTKKLQGSQWEEGINREEKCGVMLPW